MTQINKAQQEHKFVNDMEYEMPETAFKFVYQEALDPNYAENLVEELK